MCGRFVVARTLSGALPELLASLPEWSEVPENYNVALSATIPLIHDEADAVTGELRRVLDYAHWGFVAAWKKSFAERPQPFNARIETVSTSGMFRNAFQHRRAIVPAVGYYEWTVGADGVKVPYFITAPERGLAMAAVFEDWIDPAVPIGSVGHVRRSATVITREALGPAAKVHDRMPVLLAPDDYEAWLGNSLTSGAEAVSFLQESSTKISPTLELWPVDSRVGNVRNNDPSLFVPAL